MFSSLPLLICATVLLFALSLAFSSFCPSSASSSPRWKPPLPRLLGRFAQRGASVRAGYQYEERYFRQPLDHFSFADLPPFEQRYLISGIDSGARPSGPIFFYCGNEGGIEWFTANTGFAWDIDPRFSALVVFAEVGIATSSMLNGVSNAVSGDDDEVSGKTRVRSRHKRRKTVPRGQCELLQRAVRITMRWWPVILFLLAIVLLLFESSRIGRKPDNLNQPDPVSFAKESTPWNLNRLDLTTRVVNGKREPCLKILSPEKIENLEFPASAEHDFPAKRVIYKVDTGEQHIVGNGTYTLNNEVTTRFNLFTGYQTLREREESYKVNETDELHCGFYSEHGGFQISKDDKEYMQTCKVVVSTCAFGGGDDLYQPIGMTEASLMKVCYVAFWDEITLSSQEMGGKLIGDDHKIDKWRIVVVKDLPFSDQRLNGKIPKMLSHRLFPNARFSIWVDSKSQFRRDPIGILEALLWRTNSILALSEHGARSSLYDEAKAVVRKHKATPEEVEIQIKQYRLDGIPDDKRLNGKKALAEASVILREHTPSTNIFMCLWFNEVVHFTSRDQLSFPYVLRRLRMHGIYLFPVCVRKDLVNSMGHMRKVKPLVKETS